jgi:hypothetical protein
MLRKKPSEIHLKALIKLFFKYSPMLITWMGEFVARRGIEPLFLE